MKITIDEALQRGIEAQKADQLAEADSYYTAILNVQPRHPEANHNMGLIVLSRGSLEKAITFFKIAIEANPAIEQFWISYINTLLDLNQIEQAQKALSEAKGYNFRGDAIGKFEELIKPFGGRSISNSVGREPSDDQLQLITELYFKGELQLTLDRAHGLLEKFPESSSLLNILGSCFAQLNRHDDAIKCFQKMIVVKPFDSDLHFNLGKVFLDTKQIDCALRAFLSSVEINPLDHESFFSYRQLSKTKSKFAGCNKKLQTGPRAQARLCRCI